MHVTSLLLHLSSQTCSMTQTMTSACDSVHGLTHDSIAIVDSLVAGVCDDGESIGKLGEAVYRGVLHALPASARAWFGDLRDRGLSAAVEVMPHCHAQFLAARQQVSCVMHAEAHVLCVHNSKEAVLPMLLAVMQASGLSLSA